MGGWVKSRRVGGRGVGEWMGRVLGMGAFAVRLS